MSALRVLFVFVVCSVGVAAQDNTGRLPSITVHGQGEVRVAPDEVVINIGSETFDRVMATARRRNAEVIRAAIAEAQRHGVRPEDIQTDFLQIEPRYQRDDVTRNLLGYWVRNYMSVRLRDLSKFESLLTAVLQAGITDVRGVQFRSTELRKYRDQARSMALQAAQEKATALATQAGRKLGNALEISERVDTDWNAGYAFVQNAVSSVAGGDSSEGSFSAGQLAITASVTVTYQLQ